MFEGITRELGEGVISEVATAVADALLAKGIITADQKANTIGSINFLGNVALNAYLNRNKIEAKT